MRVIPWLRRGLQTILNFKPELGAACEITAGGALGVRRGAAEPVRGAQERFLAVLVERSTQRPGARAGDWG
ncbi:hypothetical protein NDU88_002655 [Pleurodeles waltl]|uniref:Uncharacterized protein n=1 Tax=Pleurodeles waltl TaxID=8319 RepID=A0AAV7T489_PLEWA|nr:hypothetical protein NDU88_002655 [Pleurodeles waltl]